MDITNITNDVDNFDKSRLEQHLEKLLDVIIDKAFDILFAIIFLYFGLKVVKFVAKIIKKSFEKTDMEDSVEGFLLSAGYDPGQQLRRSHHSALPQGQNSGGSRWRCGMKRVLFGRNYRT